MPELPDVEAYRSSLTARFVGQKLAKIRFASPFVLRTVEPPASAFEDLRCLDIQRLGKRIIFGFEGDLFLVIHLMVAGRFKLIEVGAKIPAQIGLLALDFESNSLVLYEASKKKRASIHLVRGRENLKSFDRGGLEPLTASLSQFAERLRVERHTLKRSLTDPRLFSGIGNAYSDEILHAAKLSPLRRTDQLSDQDIEQLFRATQSTLKLWTDRLAAEAKIAFPTKVTAFRPEMAVHGKYNEPCPVCGTKVQRIVYAENEANYCPRCQTDGKLLSDRSLARLLKDDWPKTIEELEGR